MNSDFGGKNWDNEAPMLIDAGRYQEHESHFVLISDSGVRVWKMEVVISRWTRRVSEKDHAVPSSPQGFTSLSS